MSHFSRRGFIGLSGAAAAGAALAGCGLNVRPGQTAELLRSARALPEPFRVPLPLPPTKKPFRSDGDTDFYEIVQRQAHAEILPGTRTPIFGYDGLFPGPTIEARRGRRVVVRQVNELPVPTVTHLHGGHTPAEHDGYPVDLVLPRSGWPHGYGHGQMRWSPRDPSRGSREYAYPMDQRAATLWYHDHRMDFTGPQVYRGLAGFHLVRDDEEDSLELPKGEHELPLLITDRAFAADGSFRYPSRDPELERIPGVEPEYMEGVMGDVVLVNGAPWPVAEVDATRYRLRLLNGSNARRYRLELDRGGELVQIASDGGLLERPVRHRELNIAPAERFDVVVDFSQYPVGSEVTLVNRLGSGSTAAVMRFRVARRGREHSAPVAARLGEVEPLRAAAAVRRREWVFTRGSTGGHRGWVINGQPFDPAEAMESIRLGDVEIWRFRTDVHHPVHVHLDPFQVLARGGRKPGDFDGGWKDTVDIRPGEIVDVAVRFTRFAGRYMMHCHNLEHEDMAMMAAFDTR